MSTPLPPGVVALPTTRPPFSNGSVDPSQPHSYFVTIIVSPGYTPPPPPVASAAPGPTQRIHPCQVDTGSCGLVVPEWLFWVNGEVGGTLIPGVKKLGPATVLYQPSSNDLQGFYYKVDEIGLGVDADGTCHGVCKNVTVVGVTGVQVSEGMMGVGFGRPNQYGDNLFLNAFGVYPSYLFTTDGIWLGYTEQTLPGSGWGFQPLERYATSPTVAPGWSTPKVNITVGTTTVPGNALLDTGVNLMMMGLAAAKWDANLPYAEVTIAWTGTGTTPILSYSFMIGQATDVPTGKNKTPGYFVPGTQPMNPTYFISMGVKSPSFVNTGINVIAGANFFFDSQVGQIGFLSLGD